MNENTRQSEAKAVLQSLESEYCAPAIQQARERQDAFLLERFRDHIDGYAIADVGCGTGYHGCLFAPGCRLYHGYEISVDIADVARARWREAGLSNIELILGDVTKVNFASEFYDLVWCLYFTPGNFREPSTELSIYTDAYLDHNPSFIAIFTSFYRALKAGGSMFLTIYKDVPETEAAQYDFYAKTGQHVVTPPGSRFVATAEHFWSVRWTRQSLLSNLTACGIREADVVMHDLNDIAWLVEVSK